MIHENVDHSATCVQDAAAPRWVSALVDAADGWRREDGATELSPFAHHKAWGLCSVRIADAASLPDNAFRAAATRAYEILRREVEDTRAHVVRLWNFVPNILGQADNGLLRYMVFNAGRHAAMTDWLGAKDFASAPVPTATGVGNYAGSDLVVHCLTHTSGGMPVENPRQKPAFRYSQRYGPLPPCFARSTRVVDESGVYVFVAGTASVVGEKSLHPNNLERQLNETIANLRAIFEASTTGDYEIVSMRAYVKREQDVATVLSQLREAFSTGDTIEWAVTDICRPELLVEVEAVLEDKPAVHVRRRNGVR